MAEFNPAVLTKKGVALLAKVQAGRTTVKFTKLVTGDGTYEGSENLTERTALKSKKQEFPLISVDIINESTVRLKAVISNNGLEAGYPINEVGVLATDPDDGEILYSMATALNNDGDRLPAYNNLLPSTITMEIYTEVSNASNVTIVANPGAYALEDDLEALEERVRVLETTTMKKYGARRAVKASTTKWERLGAAVGLVAQAAFGTGTVRNDFMDQVYPYNRVKPCNLSEAGEVKAYLGEADFDWTGKNGDVMLEVPLFFSDRYTKEEDGVLYEYRWLAAGPVDGLRIDPMFIDGDTVKEKVYLPIFQGSADVAAEPTKIRSVAGATPLVRKTRANFRTYAKAKGDGWSLDDVWSGFALQHLYIIMFADNNAQNVLGAGRSGLAYNAAYTVLHDTESSNTIAMSSANAANFFVGQQIAIGTAVGVNSVADDRTITEIAENEHVGGEALITFDGEPVSATTGNVVWSCCQHTGATIEMASPNGAIQTGSKAAMRFLYIEDWYGNCWQFVDGDNVSNLVHHLCHDRSKYADSTFTGAYHAVGYQTPNANGYVMEMGLDESEPMAALPFKVGGDTATYYADYFWQNTGDRVLIRGGSVNSGLGVGAFCWDAYDAPSSSGWSVGGRPLYK